MIRNGKDSPLNQSTGTLPNVSGAMENWFQPMSFDLITKKTINYKITETIVKHSFRGVWQSLKAQVVFNEA